MHRFAAKHFFYPSDWKAWLNHALLVAGIWGVTAQGARAQYLEANTLDVDSANVTGGMGSLYTTITVGGTAILDDSYFDSDSGTFLLPFDGMVNGDDVTFNTLYMDTFLSGGGNLSLGGNLAIGSWYDGSENWNGMQIFYIEPASYLDPFSNVTFTSASPETTWYWQQDGVGSAADQMTLDQNGTLTLTNSTSGNTFTIRPGNLTTTTTIGGNSTTRNLINYATTPISAPLYVASGYDLTIQLYVSGNVPVYTYAADIYPLGNFSSHQNGFYMGDVLDPEDSTEFDFGNQTITFPEGRVFAVGANASLTLGNIDLTVGDDTNASGIESLAIGGAANVTGNNSLAFMEGVVTGNSSITIGSTANDTASVQGNYSIALLGGNVASADDSIALGSAVDQEPTATAAHAVALGPGSGASTAGEVVVGHYNDDGMSTPVFAVGIGQNADNPADGLVIEANGVTTIYNFTTFTNSTSSQALQVNGASVINGSATLMGNVTVAEPEGDVPMGLYNNSNSY